MNIKNKYQDLRCVEAKESTQRVSGETTKLSGQTLGKIYDQLIKN